MIVQSRYSHHARRALTHASLLVTRHQHPFVDTGHLLVGVLLTRGSIGHRVLHELSIDPQQAEKYLHGLYPVLSTAPAAADYGTALNTALALAASESAWLGHHYIGTEHLLLGITRSNAGKAGDLLRRLDTSSEVLRRRVRGALKEGVSELDLNQAKRNARLSELSRRVINAAEQMAVSLDHPTVGIGHLLLVLSQERRSPTAALLHTSGLDTQRLREGLKGGDPLLLVSIEGILNRVPEEAEKVGCHYTGTEHLLLTLTLDTAGAALLAACGLEPEAVRQRLHLSAL